MELLKTNPKKLENFFKQLSVQFSIDTITILIFIRYVIFRWFLSEGFWYKYPSWVSSSISPERPVPDKKKSVVGGKIQYLVEKHSFQNHKNRIFPPFAERIFLHRIYNFCHVSSYQSFTTFLSTNQKSPTFWTNQKSPTFWTNQNLCPIGKLENGPEQAWTDTKNDVWGSFPRQSLLRQSFVVSGTLGHANISAYCRNRNTKNLIWGSSTVEFRPLVAEAFRRANGSTGVQLRPSKLRTLALVFGINSVDIFWVLFQNKLCTF